MTPPTLPEDVGKMAYEAYGESTGWKNFEGKPMPKWVNLPPNIQAAWIAAVRAVVDITQRGYVPDGWKRDWRIIE